MREVSLWGAEVAMKRKFVSAQYFRGFLANLVDFEVLKRIASSKRPFNNEDILTRRRLAARICVDYGGAAALLRAPCVPMSVLKLFCVTHCVIFSKRDHRRQIVNKILTYIREQQNVSG